MTKEDIKKALKCCETDWCVRCPYFECIGCEVGLKQDALTLITEQEKEIEQLKNANSELKEKLDEFAINLKTHILAVMLAGDKTTCDDISNAKVILYYINRQLNDTFGLNKLLNASNQFLAEPDLVKKYQIDELMEEVENDKKRY